MCALLVEVTHFNFRTNLISCIVGRLSRRGWDEVSLFSPRFSGRDQMFTRFQGSELCHNSLVKVFQEDTTGAVSLEVVRLLNRMIKESKYRVNPNALSCLLHLRLKTEIGVRASKTSVEKQPVKIKSKEKRGKGTAATQTHLSKKAKKVLKEKETIRRDMKEAGGEVDKEERNKTVCEHILGTFRGLNRSLSLAHRDVEARLRPLLPDSEEPVPDNTSTRRAARNRQILTLGQR